MTILDQVLSELREARGPIRSTELAGRLDVSETALKGMISVLVAKGMLTGSEPESIQEAAACSGVACGTSCVGLGKCPFIADVPTTFTLVIEPAAR